MRTLITEAIVVRLVDYGESDRVATLLTRDGGKLGAIARGARRSRRRFGGALELFSLGEATLERSRGELWTLTAFAAVRGFPSLSRHMTRVAHAAYACELARELSPDESHDRRLYDLVAGTLGCIDGGGMDAAGLRVYELGVLDVVGFAPALDRCVACGGPPRDDGREVLDARRGGLVCGDCGGHGPALAVAVRRALLDAQAGRAAALAVLPDAAQLEARDAIQAILREHLLRPLRSIEFIAKINAGLASS